MNTTEITKTINQKIKSLKHEVDDISDGGCLQSLAKKLKDIKKNINNFINVIDETNKLEE